MKAAPPASVDDLNHLYGINAQSLIAAGGVVRPPRRPM
jgi:hypothetical protein